MANILVVDDGRANRDFLKTVLAYAGHSIHEAADGLEALRSLESTRPELVISDILMPSMDGYEFMRRLRNIEEFAAVPAIFTSAHYLESEAKSLGQRCGVTLFLPKPSEPHEVLAVVDKALRAHVEPVRATADAVMDGASCVTCKPEDARAVRQRLFALMEVTRELARCTDLDDLSERYAVAARRIIAAEWSVVHLAPGNASSPVVNAAGFSRQRLDSFLPGWQQSDFVGRMLRGRAPVRAARRTDLNFRAGDFSPESFLGVPILSEDQVHGWVGLFNKTGFDCFHDEDEWLLTVVASQIALACDNIILSEKSRSSAAALHSTREELRLFVENTPDLIFMKDAEGRLLLANPACGEIFHAEETIGRTIAELADNDIADALAKNDLEVLESGHVVDFEQEMDTGSGKRVFHARKFPLYDGAGKPQAIGVILADITQRKNLETQLAQTQKIEALGRLAGGIAHDFNNLLSVILGYSQMALDSAPLAEAAAECIQEIQRAGKRAANLTGQLLAFSRRQTLQRKSIHLNELIGALSMMLRRLIGEHIDLVFEGAPDLGDVTADPARIEQVLVNLVLNASDAIEDGGKITIRTMNVYLDEAFLADHTGAKSLGRHVMFSVSDTGCGMPAAVRERAFEPFFTTKPQGKGTGLGLSSAYGIVKQSGGSIWLYSEPGSGTVVKVYLPRTDGQPQPQVAPEEPVTMLRGSETILLVEDEAALLKLASRILRKQGYSVIECGNPLDALDRSREFPGKIDLLFTDVIMPNMSGRELAETICRLRPDIRVIFTSGYDRDNIGRHGLLADDAPVLQKPFSLEGVASAVRAVLDGAAPAG